MLLRHVGLPEPERQMRVYPHELSGGMAQRVAIALALAGKPRLLLADEPTTALDVTVQAQVLDLLLRLRNEAGLAVVLVTHDLGIVAQYADRVSVMRAGEVVEQATVHKLFAQPTHAYTRQLLDALPACNGLCQQRAHVGDEAAARRRTDAFVRATPPAVPPHHAQDCAQWTAFPSTSRPAKRWHWWAKAAAANPPPR